MRINVHLLKGLDEKDKALVTGQAEYSKDLIKALRKEISKRIEASYIDEEEVISSDVAKMYSTLGYRRGLREVLDLIPEVKI